MSNSASAQQAEIIVLIERARNAVDYAGGDCTKSRNPVSCEAKKDKLEFEMDMGITLDKWGRPSRAPTKEYLKKISGKNAASSSLSAHFLAMI